MTPDELQRVLDNQEIKRGGDPALFLCALFLAALIVLIIRGL